ncbi:hypothetical protein [Thalassospira tepidiphila]|uniref:hypothetical protein n=1 Tax=Thalassospira tepidiphila TaxID=393657 RepID=UPI003AA80759
MAITIPAHCLFHMAHGIFALSNDKAMTKLMLVSTIHILAFLEVVVLLTLTAVGITAMIISSLNLSLMAWTHSK